MSNDSSLAAPVRAFQNEKVQRFLVYIAVMLQGLAFWRTPIFDPDLGFHLLGGAWVDRFGTAPKDDFINAFNPNWIDYHWFGQWIIYLCLKWFGWPGVQAFCGLLIAIFGAVLVRLVEVSGRRCAPIIVFLYSSLILDALFGLFSTRPTTIAVVLVSIGLLLLVERGSKCFITIFVLTVLCTNIHVYWVLFPVLWGVFVCIPRLAALLRPSKRERCASAFCAWGGLFVLIISGMLSPYGIFSVEDGFSGKLLNYFVFIDVATNPAELKPIITELRGGFAEQSMFFWTALGIFLVAARFYTLKRLLVVPGRTVYFVGTALMAIESVKYAPLFLIGSIPLMAPLLKKIVIRIRSAMLLKRIAPLVISCGVIFFLILSVYTFPFTTQNSKQTIEELRRYQPLAACEFIRDMYSAETRVIRVGTFYHIGGWCSFALNEVNFPNHYRVLMDGRTQFVPPREIIEGLEMYRGTNGWDATLQRWAPDAIVVEKGQALAQLLRRDNSWKLVFGEGNFGVFAKQNKGSPN